MVHSLLEYDEDGEIVPTSVRPIVDGGTEGFKGNARVITPGKTACIECTLDLYPPQGSVLNCFVSPLGYPMLHLGATVKDVPYQLNLMVNAAC